jgi:hypothetical protein
VSGAAAWLGGSIGVALIVRHTAAALSTMLAILFLTQMIALLLINVHGANGS